jgi:hypothetical protein
MYNNWNPYVVWQMSSYSPCVKTAIKTVDRTCLIALLKKMSLLWESWQSGNFIITKAKSQKKKKKKENGNDTEASVWRGIKITN